MHSLKTWGKQGYHQAHEFYHNYVKDNQIDETK